MNTSSPETPHPVLEQPWRYDVTELHIEFASQRLSMRLSNGSEEVTLLFSGVHQLLIDQGYEGRNSGMQILDCSANGTELARVRVCSSEQDPAIHFWAQTVERVDQ